MILRHVLFSVLLVTISSSHAQQSPPQNTQGEKQERADDKRGTDVDPLVVKVIPAKGGEDRANQEERHREKQLVVSGVVSEALKDIAWDSHANLWLTGVLVLVALGQLGYFVKQLGLMNLAMTENRRLLTAAENSATAAANTVKEMRSEATRHLRAYVTIDVDSPHYGKDGLRVRIRNHGVTPSNKTCIWTNIANSLTHKEFAYQDVNSPVLQNYLVAPKQHCTVNVVPRVAREAPETFFVYGHIDYTDIFGDRWRVDFCHEHQVSGGFFPHPEHNHEKYVGKDPDFRPAITV